MNRPRPGLPDSRHERTSVLQYWGPGQAVRSKLEEEPCQRQEAHHVPTRPTCTPCTASSRHPRCRTDAGRGIAAGDADRVTLIANYYENVLSFLETHHDGEEHLVFPLRERDAGAAALMDAMTEQHHEAIALLEQARAALAAWPGGDAAAQKATEERWTHWAATSASTSTRRRRRYSLGGPVPLHGGMGRPAGPRDGQLPR